RASAAAFSSPVAPSGGDLWAGCARAVATCALDAGGLVLPRAGLGLPQRAMGAGRPIARRTRRAHVLAGRSGKRAAGDTPRGGSFRAGRYHLPAFRAAFALASVLV